MDKQSIEQLKAWKAWKDIPNVTGLYNNNHAIIRYKGTASNDNTSILYEYFMYVDGCKHISLGKDVIKAIEKFKELIDSGSFKLNIK